MAVTVNLIKQLELPKHQNFIRFVKDKDGRGVQGSIDVGELDQEGFEDYLNELNKSFRKHWQERRKNIVNGDTTRHTLVK